MKPIIGRYYLPYSYKQVSFGETSCTLGENFDKKLSSGQETHYVKVGLKISTLESICILIKVLG